MQFHTIVIQVQYLLFKEHSDSLMQTYNFQRLVA